MDDFGSVLVVLNGLSLPVKVAWGVWVAWGLAQLVWYFWSAGGVEGDRGTHPEARQSAGRPIAVRPPSSSKRVIPAVAPYGTSDFLAALDEEQAALAAQGQSDKASAYR